MPDLCSSSSHSIPNCIPQSVCPRNCLLSKRMKSTYAAGGEFQKQTWLTLSDGSHKLRGIVETQLAGSAPNMFGEGVILLIRKLSELEFLIRNTI